MTENGGIMGLLDFLKKDKPAEAQQAAEATVDQATDQATDAAEQALADVPEQPIMEEAPVAEAPAQEAAAGPAFPGRILRQGVSGEDVRTWQAKMSERGWDLGVDGDYGPGSASVCRRFQSEKGLGADGEVGPQTWAATWSAPVT